MVLIAVGQSLDAKQLLDNLPPVPGICSGRSKTSAGVNLVLRDITLLKEAAENKKLRAF
jgi:hypothetical protein